MPNLIKKSWTISSADPVRNRLIQTPPFPNYIRSKLYLPTPNE